jgi:hypothetical protein
MNRWKIATGALAIVVLTGFTTSLVTAYLLRPGSPAGLTSADNGGAVSMVPRASATPAVGPVTPASRPRVVPAVQRTVTSQAAGPRSASQTPRSTSVSTGSVRPVADTSAAECASTGDRVWRVAKPGLLGTVLGAGMGAAGGAIANGGNGAGKGAMIGGLAGAAVGSAYGAYKTKQECGTVLGPNAPGFLGGSGDREIARGSATPAPNAPEAAFSNRGASPSGDGITVYNVK